MNAPILRASRLRLIVGIGALATTMSLSGCATITGTATGAFTGFVDLPREVVDSNAMPSDAAGTWAVTVLLAPVGFVTGPLLGFVKGVALDVSALQGTLTLGEEFGSCGRASVWRPFSFGWAQGR